MAAQLETTLRGPEAYGLARRVIEAMESEGVWPTPLNFEIWVHYLGDPEGALGREIKRILAASEPFTEATADMLAAEYLPRGRLTEEIRDAGRVLDRELSSVSDAISKAHKSQAAYGQTLDKAATSIETAGDGAGLLGIGGGAHAGGELVGLFVATGRVGQPAGRDIAIGLLEGGSQELVGLGPPRAFLGGGGSAGRLGVDRKNGPQGKEYGQDGNGSLAGHGAGFVTRQEHKSRPLRGCPSGRLSSVWRCWTGQ